MKRPAAAFVAALSAFFALATLLPPARADGPARASFDPAGLDVLPVHDVEWALLARDHPDDVAELLVLGQRAKKIGEHLAARPDPNDAGGRILRAESQRVVEQIAERIDALRPALAALGIDDDVLSVTRDVPAGPRRPVRQAVRLVGMAPGVAARAKALLEVLVPRVDGALLALDAAVQRERAAGATSADALATEAAALERRFWRVVDAALDDAARAWLRRRLPNDVAKSSDLLEHVFLLPDLTPSQLARIQALVVGVDAASAGDRAALAKIPGGPLAPAGREPALRLAGVVADAWARGLAILTPAQRLALAALPPRLTAKERGGDLKEVLAAVDLDPAEQEAARRLAVAYGPTKGRLAERLVALALRARAEPAESPRAAGLQAESLAAYASALLDARRAATAVFVDLLRPDQVTQWVLGNGAGAAARGPSSPPAAKGQG